MEKRYQIFISSTYADLVEERKAIMEAIVELDCFPAGMEMFPAVDSEQFEYIKTIINESDYYVLVVAGRYGSIAEDGDSYTEKEFNYAVEQGIPILAFVKKDISTIPLGKVDTDSLKREKLELFRSKVLDGRLAKFWNNTSELKYELHSSLSRAFKMNPRIGWVRGDTLMTNDSYEKLHTLETENIKLKKKIELLEANTKGEESLLIKIDSNIKLKYLTEGEEEFRLLDLSIKEMMAIFGVDLIVYGLSEYSINNCLSEYIIQNYDEFCVKLDTKTIDEIILKLILLELVTVDIGHNEYDGEDTFKIIELTKLGKNIMKQIINI